MNYFGFKKESAMTGCKSFRFAVLCGLLQTSIACADVFWLSETAPPKAAPDAMQHEHHHEMPAQSAVAAAAPAAEKKHDHDAQVSLDGEAPGKDHQPGKQVWLRSGDNIKSAQYIATANSNERLTMIDLDGGKTEFDAESVAGRLTLKTSLPKVGFYDLYLEQCKVENGKLQVQLPKAELLWASCVAKEVDEEAVAKPIINVNSPLEVVREHKPDEGCMVRLVSGDVVNFLVLSFGKPLAGIPVTMITQEGWRNTVVSDDSGRASFTVIRAYFPKWFEFKKYHTDTFIAVAEMDKNEAGALDGTPYTSAHYVATLPGKYRPSPYDYRSYAWGLGIALFVIVFGGVAIYLYRRRRLKPYQEVRVDDKA
jgi:hypothetical protein